MIREKWGVTWRVGNTKCFNDSQVDTNGRGGGSQWRPVAIDDKLEPNLHPAAAVLAFGEGYAPNTSKLRRRRQVEAAKVLRGRLEAVEPVRERRNDWWELWGLSQGLVFEVLRTALIIGLIIVRLSTASAEKVGEWLQIGVPADPDEEDIRQPENVKDESNTLADIETAKTIRQREGIAGYSDRSGSGSVGSVRQDLERVLLAIQIALAVALAVGLAAALVAASSRT